MWIKKKKKLSVDYIIRWSKFTSIRNLNNSKTGYTYIYRNKRIYFIHTISRRYFSTNPVFLHSFVLASTFDSRNCLSYVDFKISLCARVLALDLSAANPNKGLWTTYRFSPRHIYDLPLVYPFRLRIDPIYNNTVPLNFHCSHFLYPIFTYYYAFPIISRWIYSSFSPW